MPFFLFTSFVCGSVPVVYFGTSSLRTVNPLVAYWIAVRDKINLFQLDKRAVGEVSALLCEVLILTPL